MGDSDDRKAARWWAAMDTGVPTYLTQGRYQVPSDFYIQERVLDQHICNLVLEQSVVVSAAGQRHEIAPGGVFWIAPGVRHSLYLARAGEPFSMLNTRFRLTDANGSVGFPEQILVAHGRWDLRPWFDTLIDDGLSIHPQRDERARRIWYLLYTDLRRLDEPDTGLDRRRRRLIHRRLAQSAAAPPTPADLARLVGLSADYFRRVFLRSFGVSPRTWIARQRIHLAAQYLLDYPGASVASVGAHFGYPDAATFSHRFRAVMGCSPQAWRRS